MVCFCSAKLDALMGSFSAIPSLLHLVPPVSVNLVAAAGGSLGLNAGVALAANASASASAVANLSAMASLSAALRAALGMDLTAALSASAVANVRADLAGRINGFNANGNLLMPHLNLLNRLLAELAGLVNLSGVLLAVKAAFAIDLRLPGAVAALQARLAASAHAAVSAKAQVSAVASLMAALGFKANAQGALAVNAQAQAVGSLVAGLPTIGSGFSLLSLLAALLSMLDAIRLGLGVNLLAPTAAVDLRLALSQLPLSALARLDAHATATATASASLAASASANAAAALDLRATGQARLAAAGQIAMLLQVMAKAGLGLPAGSCGMPCPLALLSGLPALPAGSAAASARIG